MVAARDSADTGWDVQSSILTSLVGIVRNSLSGEGCWSVHRPAVADRILGFVIQLARGWELGLLAGHFNEPIAALTSPACG